MAHKENYRLVQVNGQSTNLQRRIKQGYFKPGGEFGTALWWIFNPKAKTEFVRYHREASDGRNICVFQYHVPIASTTWTMQVNVDRVPMAHHGLVQADCRDGAVLRIQMESEPARIRQRGHDLALGARLDMRYGPVTIAAREFLLPQGAEEVALFAETLTKAEIRFRDYRKYESNSTIKFGEGDPKPDPARQ